MEFNARCILAKGARYPQTLPHPVVALVPLGVPLCHPDQEKTNLEHQFLKTLLLSSTVSSDSDTTEVLVKLFALACKSDHESRALEVARMMDASSIQV